MDFSARRVRTDEFLATGSDDIKLRPRFSDVAVMKSHIISDWPPGSCENNDVRGSGGETMLNRSRLEIGIRVVVSGSSCGPRPG